MAARPREANLAQRLEVTFPREDALDRSGFTREQLLDLRCPGRLRAGASGSGAASARGHQDSRRARAVPATPLGRA
jgi:hypothetical protein